MGTLTYIYIWDAPGAECWLRDPWQFFAVPYKMLYNTHASPRGPCVAIQLYSAIHYTGIHRYTLYNLCNTPLRAARDRFVGATPVAPARVAAGWTTLGTTAFRPPCSESREFWPTALRHQGQAGGCPPRVESVRTHLHPHVPARSSSQSHTA